MPYSQLRELARAYAAGQVSRDEYRAKRAALIGDFATGKLQIDYRDIVAPKPVHPPTVIIDVGEEEPEVRRAPIILGAIAIVLGIGAAGFWYLRLQVAPPPAVAAAQPVSPAAELVARFVAADDYGAAACDAFERAWAEFEEEERAAAQRDQAWKRLVFALRAKLRDQQALVAVDTTGAAAIEETRLREFAGRIGVRRKLN
jgi:hypothetical protein